MSNDYVYHLHLFNDLGEDVTFKFTSVGTVTPEREITLAYGHCEWMNVTNAQNSITLEIHPKNKKPGDPNFVIFRKPKNNIFSECDSIKRQNCDPNYHIPYGNSHWEVMIKHSYKSSGIIPSNLLNRETLSKSDLEKIPIRYTNGKRILSNPPQAQTPVTATDKQR
ncbi:MAG: hypothetical protein NT166_02910 [Candidatus Aminicenantes bacterium]|nr:hypothetical protein [Candidatus Aminicenantes bacterium]